MNKIRFVFEPYLFIEANKEVAHRECLLTLLLQFADTFHTAANEDGRK